MADILIDLPSFDHFDSNLLLLLEIDESLSSFHIVIYEYLEINKIHTLNDAILKFNHDFLVMVGELWKLYQVLWLHF